MHLSQQYSTGKKQYYCNESGTNNEYWERWKTDCSTNARKISCCKTVLFLFFMPFFFAFKRIKTNLNKNCERSHAFDTYMPHFYSSNTPLKIKERFFF